jgi:hypothetical protein
MQVIWRYSAVLTLFLATAGVLFGQAPARPEGKQARPRHNAVEEQVKDLRDLVAAQQQQLESQGRQMDQLKAELQQLLEARREANSAAQKEQGTAEQVRSAADQAQQTAAEAQRLAEEASANAVEAKTSLALLNGQSQEEGKRISSLEGLVGRFRFNGDIRVRGESFFQDCAACVQRSRARIRLRFGVEGKLNEEFTGGFALATGSMGDPTTTNETLTNFFDRKTIAVDRGYISYKPMAHPRLQLTGGKFAYTWNRTQVTGDPDINPEGFSEKFSWELKSPVVKNFTLQGMQLLFSELSGGTDSYALGGQVASRMELGPWTATPSLMALKWNNPDAILQANAFAVAATTTTGGLPVPGEGPGCAQGVGLPSSPPCAFSPNGMTNATFTDAAGKPHFLSRFFYLDFILNNQFETGWKRWPLNLLLEYEQNLDAASHPLDASGNVIPTLGPEGRTYLADISLGHVNAKNGVQFGYAWLREEQDAAIASFAESDQRAPTNIVQNRFYALWKVRSNTVASYTFWYGRTLNSALQHAVLAPGTTPGTTEPHLKRMQFDLIYFF